MVQVCGCRRQPFLVARDWLKMKNAAALSTGPPSEAGRARTASAHATDGRNPLGVRPHGAHARARARTVLTLNSNLVDCTTGDPTQRPDDPLPGACRDTGLGKQSEIEVGGPARSCRVVQARADHDGSDL